MVGLSLYYAIVAGGRTYCIESSRWYDCHCIMQE